MLLYSADVVESDIREVPIRALAAKLARVAGVEDVESLGIKREGLEDSLSTCSRPISNRNRPFNFLRILFVIQV